MLFLSYSRRDRDAMAQLRDDLHSAGHDTWCDNELTGGQQWWDTILENIRACDRFVFVLSPDSVKSRACKAELAYAVALGRPVLPVLVRDLAVELAPDPIGETHIIDLRERSPEGAIALVTAVAAPPAAPPIEVIADAPPVPMTDLGPVRDRIGATDLSMNEQRGIVTELLAHVDDVEQHATIARLLNELASRADLVESVRPEIEALRERLDVASSADEAPERRAARADLIRSIEAHLETGRFTPIIGPGVTRRLLGDRAELAAAWAESFDFPLAPHRRTDLAGVAQFVSVMTNQDTLLSQLEDFVRNRVADKAGLDPSGADLAGLLQQAWDLQHGGEEADAHEVLASLPVPIYVLTEPWPLLTHALRAAGRDPVVDLCRWRDDVWDWPESIFEQERDYRPSVERPLVFHAFGSIDVPDSLVITEDDYLDFAIAISSDQSLVPPPVRRALADSALLLLGLDLEDWDVRVLLRSMVGQEGAGRLHRYTHVAAQVDPSSGVSSPERTRLYLERYFGRFRQPAIDIYWGSVEELVTDLASSTRVTA